MDPSTGVSLLVVEDDPDDARFVERLLVEHRAGFHSREGDAPIEIESIEHADRLDGALERIDANSTDVVLLDLGLPDSSGLETVDAVVGRAPTVPIVVLTGRTDAGVEAIRRGAQDYLVKGRITAELLLRTIRYSIERARVTRELRDRNHRLALTNEIVRTDLRNDVSLIVGLSDQLRDRVDPGERETVESVLDASRHVLELTETAAELMDVLTAESIGAREPVDLEGVLESELEAFRREYDADLSVDRPEPGDEPLTVAGTPMLGSVFEHLLSNAATHTDREVPQVAVSVESTDDRATVSIADDGVGISDSRKELILDSDAGAGTGAGLYFVTTVLESVGADIEIEDREPRGTIVTVSFDRIAGR